MDNPLYFLHIPKTGGTSFTSFLDSHFAPDDVCPAHLLPDFFHLPFNALSRYILYRGHLWYGLNSYLDRNLSYITMLRDPIQRTISYYSHVRRDENAYRHRRVIDENWSLLDFLGDKETNWDVINTQTLFLAVDLDYSQLARDPVGYGQAVVKQYAQRQDDRALLDIAKTRLEHFVFVGITERMRDSMLLLSYQMDWYPDSSTPVSNASPTTEDEMSYEAMQTIIAINRLDQELYEWACQLFEERFSQMVMSLIVAKHKANNIKITSSWHMQPLPIEERRLFDVRILEAPSEAYRSETFHVVTEIANNSNWAISSAAPNPLHISYHFMGSHQESITVFDGERTIIMPRLAATEKREFSVSVKAPNTGGRYILRVTIVQEGVAWFDEEGSNVFSDMEIVVE